MRTALVTGGTGFVGHFLANRLNEKGYKVTVLDTAYNNKEQLNKGINFLLADVRTNCFENNFDYVYHLAAKRSIMESFSHPQDYMSTNIWGTYNVIQHFQDSRIINVSSSAALEPKSIYAISKKSSEQFANLHKKCVNVRLMNIFGERQLALDMAIPSFMYHLKHGTTSIINGDGTITRDYTYVLDAVDELIRIGEDKKRGTTEIGYSNPVKIIDLYHLLCRVAKKKPNLKHGPPRKGDMKKTCSKYKIDEPQYGFTEGLRRTVKWYLKCKEF